MARVLILVALIGLVVWWVLGRVRRGGDAEPRRRRGAGGAAEEMVACAHCGVHLPRVDAVLDGERPYCCDEHRRLGPRGR